LIFSLWLLRKSYHLKRDILLRISEIECEKKQIAEKILQKQPIEKALLDETIQTFLRHLDDIKEQSATNTNSAPENKERDIKLIKIK